MILSHITTIYSFRSFVVGRIHCSSPGGMSVRDMLICWAGWLMVTRSQVEGQLRNASAFDERPVRSEDETRSATCAPSTDVTCSVLQFVVCRICARLVA